MRPEDHPGERTARLIGRRWTTLVVQRLAAGPLRHGELLARMCGVSQKTLTERLRELERHGAIARETLAGPVPGTVYSLTPRGRELAGLLGQLGAWGEVTLPAPPIVSPPPATDRPGSSAAASFVPGSHKIDYRA